MLLDDIKKENMQAMKDHDELKHKVLPTVMAKALELKVKRRAEGKELTDADVIDVIKKLIAELDESIAQYEQYGRAETAAELKKQKEVLLPYVPQQMSEEEIRAEIAKLDDKSMPSIMKHFKTNFQGKVDLSLVSKIARG